MTVFQIKRTPTPGNQPPPNSLFEGELAVDMAEPIAPRLWVGVPASIDPTGMRLVSDMSQAATGDYVPLDGSVSMTGQLTIQPPGPGTNGSLVIDTTLTGANSFISLNAGPAATPISWVFYNYASGGNVGALSINQDFAPRLRIEPQDPVNPLPPPPVVIGADGSLNLYKQLNFSGQAVIFQAGGPYIASSDRVMLFVSPPDANAGFTFQNGLTNDIYFNYSSGSNNRGLTINGYLQVTGIPEKPDSDAMLHLIADTQIWVLITQSSSSGIPGAFTLADQTTGDRRFNIHPAPAGTALPIELLATNELVLAVDPTSPMGAVTKQYADSLSAGGGAYVPLDGSLPMTGGLTIDSSASGGNAYILLTATHATGPGTWAIYNYDQSAVQGGAFSINDGPSRFRIDPVDPAAPLPPPPVVIGSAGDLQLGTGADIYFNGATPPPALVDPKGPMISANDTDMTFRSGPAWNDPGVYGNWYFRDYDGRTVIEISARDNHIAVYGAGPIGPGYITAPYIYIGESLCFRDNDSVIFTAVDSAGNTTGGLTPPIDYRFWDYGLPPAAGNPYAPAIRMVFSTVDSSTSHNADAHVFRSYDSLTEYARFDANGLVLPALGITGPLDTGGNYNSASILLTSGAQAWRIEAEDAGSSAPGAFSIGDATTGTRLLTIEPGVNGQTNIPRLTSDRVTVTGPLNADYVNSNGIWSLSSIVCEGRLTLYEQIYVGLTSNQADQSLFMDRTAGPLFNIYIPNSNPNVTPRLVALEISGAAITARAPLLVVANPVQPLEVASKQYVDTALAAATGGATVSDVAPAAPTPGSLWFDSANLRMSVWYDDGTSQQWIAF